MRQLLKLDGIQAEGEAKLQRKAEVEYLRCCRKFNFVLIVELISITTKTILLVCHLQYVD